MKYTVVDIGTNSARLMIASVKSGRAVSEYKTLRMIRVGEGMVDKKRITEAAMARTKDTLLEFLEISRSYGAQHNFYCFATSAVREAENKEDFLDYIKKTCGIDIEIISGDMEAILGFAGSVCGSGGMFDIGGGSTEFLVGEEGKVLYANSIKLGAVRLTNKFFKDKKLKTEIINDARIYARNLVYPVVRNLKHYDYDMVIGTSGTITTIGAIIYAEKNEYDSEQVILNKYTFDEDSLYKAVKKILKAETETERAKIPGLDFKRADIIPAGAIILEQLFIELGIKKITLSNYALREGILIDTISKEQTGFQLGNLSDICYKSIITLAENCNYDKIHSEHVLKLSVTIFDYLKVKYHLSDKDKNNPPFSSLD